LTTDHEYGAIDRAWRFACRRTGASFVRRAIPLPVTTPEAFIEQFWAGVNERTRVIAMSHVTSPTALTFPVREIARRARAAGILTVIDGAHAPSNIPVDLTDLGADFYGGSCHKWMCAPKGTAFLYARPEAQPLLEPLIVSFGWESDRPGPSRFIDYHQIQGTRDSAGYLAVPAAIEFQEKHNWTAVRARCHKLAVQTRQRINALTGLDAICPESTTWFSQMADIRLPDIDMADLGRRLFEDYRIEVPCLRWNNQALLRLSVQGYVSEEDLDALIGALERLLRG
jgi:isopenicillin-N epimerase